MATQDDVQIDEGVVRITLPRATYKDLKKMLASTSRRQRWEMLGITDDRIPDRLDDLYLAMRKQEMYKEEGQGDG